jgi:phage terminase Nu1 subunit (DNA packaging protein)
MSEETKRVMRKAEFAAFIGRSPSYVTKLLKDGRLVMQDAKRVLVAESLKLIADTKGGRDDVSARWAERAGAEIPEAPAGAGSGEPSGGDGTVRQARAEAEARKASAQAEQEEMKAAQMRGDLVPREEVEAAMRFVGAAVRAEWDVLADQVAPLVAPVSAMDECHALLQDHGRNALDRLGQLIARQREELAKGSAK